MKHLLKRVPLTLICITTAAAFYPNGLRASNVGNENIQIQVHKNLIEEFEFAVFDIDEAYESTAVHITVGGTGISSDGWQAITNYLTAAFGRQPDVQTATTIAYQFLRGDLGTIAWLEQLSDIEMKYVEVESKIQQDARCAGALVEIGLV